MKQGNTVNRPFPTTQWTLISRVASDDESQRSEALEELCHLYWPPVYAFIRSKGANRAEAEDLTQGFFVSILSRDDLARVSSEAGKLRSFMLGAVSNFMANAWRSKQCLKRGGGVEVLSLDLTYDDSEEKIIEPADTDTPESIFDRQWALTLLGHVLESLRQKYVDRNQERLFESLRFVISPGTPGNSYAEIAASEGMSESAVKVAAHRLKERYGKLLRETIAVRSPRMEM